VCGGSGRGGNNYVTWSLTELLEEGMSLELAT